MSEAHPLTFHIEALVSRWSPGLLQHQEKPVDQARALQLAFRQRCFHSRNEREIGDQRQVVGGDEGFPAANKVDALQMQGGIVVEVVQMQEWR